MRRVQSIIGSLFRRFRARRKTAQGLTAVEYEAVTMMDLEGRAAFEVACEQSWECQFRGSPAASDFWASVAVEIARRTRQRAQRTSVRRGTLEGPEGFRSKWPIKGP